MANLGQISDDAHASPAANALNNPETQASGDTGISDDAKALKIYDAAGVRTGGRTVVYVG